MVALEQHHDRQVHCTQRAGIIIEPSHACKVHFVRYQEASHALHMRYMSARVLNLNAYCDFAVI